MKYELPKELTPRNKRRSSLLRRIVIAIAFFVIMPIALCGW